MVAKYRFSSMDADYFQFHLKDAEANGSLSEAVTPEALARDLAVAPFIVGVFTERNTAVWVDVEQYEGELSFRTEPHWRKIIDCSLHLPSGHLVITSPTLELPLRGHILMEPGWYRLRIHYGKHSTVGAHRYKVVIWPDVPAEVVIRKSDTLPVAADC